MDDKTKTETKLVAAEAPKKMVKIKTNHPIRIDCFEDPRKTRHIREGEEVMVTEEEAKEYCDHPFERPFGFFGERYSDQSTQRTKFYRATRTK